MSPLATLLREMRIAYGLSQVKFGEIIGLLPPQICYMENGRRYAPSVLKLKPAMAELGVTIDQWKMILEADKQSPKVIRVPTNAPESAFLLINTLIENFQYFTEEDFDFLEKKVRELAEKRRSSIHEESSTILN